MRETAPSCVFTSGFRIGENRLLFWYQGYTFISYVLLVCYAWYFFAFYSLRCSINQFLFLGGILHLKFSLSPWILLASSISFNYRDL